jgi:hypothetical protein
MCFWLQVGKMRIGGTFDLGEEETEERKTVNEGI